MNVPTIRSPRLRLAVLGAALATSMGLAQAAGPAPVTRVFIVEVPPAQDHDFNAGVQAWHKCLHDHGDSQVSYVYDSETGDLSRYVILSPYSSWGGMDVHDPAGKACRDTFATSVLPHVSQAFSAVSQLNAKDSYMPGGDADPAPMLWVSAYRIKPGQGPAFHEGMAKFAAAAAKIHWEVHFGGYDEEGSGQGAENFVVVSPQKSWADAGQDPTPSAKEMMEKVYGKAAAASMRQKSFATVADQWSDVWSYDKDLSFIPGK